MPGHVSDSNPSLGSLRNDLKARSSSRRRSAARAHTDTHTHKARLHLKGRSVGLIIVFFSKTEDDRLLTMLLLKPHGSALNFFVFCPDVTA